MPIYTKNLYFLSHNGLGDNITNIGALRYLSKYYIKIFFLCKKIHEENLKIIFKNTNIIPYPFKGEYEYDECPKIIHKAIIDNEDVMICGVHKYIHKNVVTIKELLDYKPNNSNYNTDITYTISFDPINNTFIKQTETLSFIHEFYRDINLDTSIYVEFFDIPSDQISTTLWNNIKNFNNIIFVHSSSSTNFEVKMPIDKYVNDDQSIIICANKNLYPSSSNLYKTANIYVNLPIQSYIDIIKHANMIFVVDSCFTCIVLPLLKSKRLKAFDTQVHIVHRDAKLL